MKLLLSLLPALLCLLCMSSGAQSVATEWIIFDASNDSIIYGNPSYQGYLGMPNLPSGVTIEKFFFGHSHVVGLANNGSLYGWGKNTNAIASGWAAAAAIPPIYEPILLPKPSAVLFWKAVAVSDNATIALSLAGDAYVTGVLGGHLYIGWTRVSAITDVCLDLSCGMDHCIVVTTLGLSGIGANDQNQAVPVPFIGPTATLPASTSHANLTSIDLADLAPDVTITPTSSILTNLPQICTGQAHTAIVWHGIAFIWGSCDAVFSGVCSSTPATNGIWIPSLTPVSGSVLQLGCGKAHTIIRTTVSTYAIGSNLLNQVSSSAVGFATAWTDFFPTRANRFGLNPFVVAGDLVLGRNVRLGTTFMPSSLVSKFAGLLSDSGDVTPDDGSPSEPITSTPESTQTNTTFAISAFKRPAWLRLRRIDAAFGSSIRSTLAIRFREDEGACPGNRPWSSIVCAPSLINPVKSGWISQRSLSLTASAGNTTLTLPGSISVFGQLWTDPALTISVPYSKMESFPALAVSECAQLQGSMNIAMDSEAYKIIKSKSGSKVTFPLVQAGCRMYDNDNMSNKRQDLALLRDDGSINSVTGEMYVVDLNGEERLVRSPGFVYSEFVGGEFEESIKRDSEEAKATPEASYTDPSVPDGSVPPSNPASSESSNSTISLTVSSGTNLKSCQKRSLSTSQQTSGSTTQLVATMSVTSSGCDTWWIILVSVICGIVLLVIIVLIVVFTVPAIRVRVLPYKGSRS